MIEVKDLKKSYTSKKKDISVLKNVNFSINKGEIVAIMGKSGVGKSTLLSILAGLEKPDNGVYLFNNEIINNKSVNELAQFRRDKIGLILQSSPLIDTKSMFDNVSLPLHYSKIQKENITKKTNDILHKLNIHHLKDRWIHSVSGGEAQRVGIARALIQDPELILADEPTGSLDEETEREILDIFLKLNKEGKTLIIVTHNKVVASICNKIYRIENGECLLQSI